MLGNEDSDIERNMWLRAAIEAAKMGGCVLQEWKGRFSVREKSRANLVTEADEASQSAILNCLKGQFPEHGFLGEESLNDRSNESVACWIIDPLDGTTNYVHGFPYYCVSIALAYRGLLEIGVIYDPNRDEVFTAARTKGAFCNGLPIRTSGESNLKSAMAIASLPVATDPDNPAVKRFLTGLTQLQTVQRTGSAALNMAYIGCGRVDAFWSSSLHPWDVAAGALIVQEAGGSVTNLQGDTFDLFVPSVLAASTANLAQDLATALR